MQGILEELAQLVAGGPRLSEGMPDFLRTVAELQLSRGDWRLLGMAAINLRRGSADSAMAFMMDDSSGATGERLALIEEQRMDAGNLIADALSYPYFPESVAACGNPDLGDDFRAPFDCDVPTLFVSGDLDARTPRSNVEALLPGFACASHVHILSTGHDARELEFVPIR